MTADRRQVIAEVLGLDPNAVSGLDSDVLIELGVSFLQEGVIVDLRLSRWRARAPLTYEDLGLPEMTPEQRRALHNIFHLGDKYFLPQSVLKRLAAAERAIYRALEKRSFLTPWGRFVPATAFSVWKAEHDSLVGAYLALRDELVGNWSLVLDELRDQYGIAARHAFSVIRALRSVQVTEAEFVAQVWERIRLAIPEPDSVRQSFQVQVFYRLLPPEALAPSPHPNQTQMPGMEVDLLAERQRIVAAMQREVAAELAAQKRELIDSFLHQTLVEMRLLVYEVVVDALAGLEGKPALHPRSRSAIVNLVEQLSVLNFFDDREISAMLQSLRSAVPVEGNIQPEHIREVLRSVALVARSTLIGLGESPRSARAMGVPDMPDPAAIRAARDLLGLSTPSILTASVATPVRDSREILVPAPDAPPAPLRQARRLQ